MEKLFLAGLLLLSGLTTGCEATKKVGNTAGQVVGEGANIAGSVTDGGAEAVQGRTTSEENPYGR